MKTPLILSAILVLSACSDSDNDDVVPPLNNSANFMIEAVNLTTGQPLSPLAVVAHDSNTQVFAVGEAASTELEVLAESGDNGQLLGTFDTTAQASGVGVITPGAAETIELEVDMNSLDDMRLSIVTMLVNTNDAITGINAAAIGQLPVGQTMTVSALAYDSGTEANRETVAEIPGPAAGGEGFNARRDDVRDQVTMHGGVVTRDDGLAGSALQQQHRFDNPVARFRITRTR